MTPETLKELFVEHIRDIYDAEKQLVKAIPKLSKAAESEELASALQSHLEETKGQVSRLEQVFDLLGEPAKVKPCKAMKGLIEEGDEAAGEEKGELRDLAIIAAAQKVEHYEISAYGTACAMADRLGLEDAVELLRQTEDEERNADETLTSVAMGLYDSVDSTEDSETAGVGTRTAQREPKRKSSR
ncbi:MAG: ferritin-like domain-containing protein [Bryobacteraceae bacterium]